MRVEIIKPVGFRGEIVRGGVVDAPQKTADHWLATGAAKAAPDTAPAPAVLTADNGKKTRF